MFKVVLSTLVPNMTCNLQFQDDIWENNKAIGARLVVINKKIKSNDANEATFYELPSAAS